MNLKRLLSRFDAFQQSRRWLAVPMAVLKKSSDDQGGHLAALVAWYGFFSLFPLLLVFATILGFVLAGDPDTRHSVETSVTSSFPAVGQLLPLHTVTGSVLALVIGVVTSLYGGLGVTNAAQQAMDRIWAVPFKDRANWAQARLRGLGLLGFLGALFIVSTLASGAVSAGFGGPLATVAGYVIALLVNAGLFFAAYRLMTVSEIPSSDLRTGALVASLLWTILQSVGGYYIKHAVSGSHSNYGRFAIVIGLLIWLRLGAQVFMYCAEVNVVTSRRLWPRSYFGPPDEPADQRTLRALAKVEERSDAEHVDVAFQTPPPSGATENPPTGG